MLAVHPPSVASATRQHGDCGNSYKRDECSAPVCDQSCDTQRQQTLAKDTHTEELGHNLFVYAHLPRHTNRQTVEPVEQARAAFPYYSM